MVALHQVQSLEVSSPSEHSSLVGSKSWTVTLSPIELSFGKWSPCAVSCAVLPELVTQPILIQVTIS